jgi:hypothetical protein
MVLEYSVKHNSPEISILKTQKLLNQTCRDAVSVSAHSAPM